MDVSTLFEICEMNSISLMQEYVNIVAEWTNNNDMKINSEKSKEMLISYARRGNLGNADCDGWVMSAVWRMVAFQKTSSTVSWLRRGEPPAALTCDIKMSA